MLPAAVTVARGESKPKLEVRNTTVPFAFFEDAAGGIELAASGDQASTDRRVLTLSTQGLARSFGALLSRCRTRPESDASRERS
jgi:hypothetical protein